MFQRPRKLSAAAALVGAVLVGGGAGAASYAAFSSSHSKTVVRQVTVAGAEPASSERSLSVSQIYQRTNKGVVEITVTSTGDATPFAGPQTQRAQGSGFVYDDSGHVVTNQHVVDGADSISVTFWNGATYKAALVGSDASTDLAVVDVDAPTSLLHPLALGDSGKVGVGDGVVAIGSPFGLEESVTSGIVSAVHRSMTAPNDFTINDSIQTDAAINHGNSGGPLLDMQGRVIGVNAQIESDSGGSDGVGFAIPSNTVQSIVSQLISNGNVRHAYLGVAVETIPASIAAALDVHTGVELTQVRSGTPADRAGLHASSGTRTVDGQEYPTGGDVITAIDGKAVSTAAELQAAIDAKRPRDTISVTYSRAGKSHTVRVKLATRPS
jgi:putative serine protease PepD